MDIPSFGSEKQIKAFHFFDYQLLFKKVMLLELTDSFFSNTI